MEKKPIGGNYFNFLKFFFFLAQMVHMLKLTYVVPSLKSIQLLKIIASALSLQIRKKKLWF